MMKKKKRAHSLTVFMFAQGLEFTTALQSANEKNTDIILADQPAQDTLYRLGRLPWLSLSMWKNWVLDQRFSWKDSNFCREAKALRTALLGNPSLPASSQLSILSFVGRNGAAIQDLVRMAISTIALVMLTASAADPQTWLTASSALSMDISAVQDGLVSSQGPLEATYFAVPSWPDSIDIVVMDVVGIVFWYLTIVLPTVRVILRERDDRLVEGIQAASRKAVAARQQELDKQQPLGRDQEARQEQLQSSGDQQVDGPRVCCCLGSATRQWCCAATIDEL